MRNTWRRGLSLLLVLALSAALAAPAFAAVSKDRLESAIGETALYIQKNLLTPTFGSGDWEVFGLARSGRPLLNPGYFDEYQDRVELYVMSKNGQLHKYEYTNYSRVILSLSSIGVDPKLVGGYDLTKPLGDYEMTLYQGLNGGVWALIALDSLDYPMPQNPAAKVQATRQMYVDHILEKQNAKNGGWSAQDDMPADTDMTAMTLQALANYQDQPLVKAATARGLDFLSGLQSSTGGYASMGLPNAESCAQVLVALCALGIDPQKDERFIKNGNTVVDALMSYYCPGGGFGHASSGEPNGLAVSQGFYALVAYDRFLNGKHRLHDLTPEKPPQPDPDGHIFSASSGSDGRQTCSHCDIIKWNFGGGRVLTWMPQGDGSAKLGGTALDGNDVWAAWYKGGQMQTAKKLTGDVVETKAGQACRLFVVNGSFAPQCPSVAP